jgi:M6 family metalloprotease-like protein
MMIYAILGLVLITVTAVVAAPPEFMPAHPDLLKQLGRAKVAELQERHAPPRMEQELAAQRAKRGAAKVSGTGTCLVILWEFTDHPADQGAHPSSAYHDMMFSTAAYPTGSMNDFYRENSYGTYGIGGDVVGWTTSLHTYDSYANGDGSQDASTAREMIIDAVAQLDPSVDFSQYDNDGPDGVPHSGDDDGYVDALFFVHAGPGQEQTGDPADIWSHASAFYSGLSTGDGVSVRRYSVEPEELLDGSLMTVGVFCHEYGHVLGLPDLYDTDYSSSGIGEWGLMSGGSWNNRSGDPAGSSPSHLTAWCKQELGWLTPVTVTASSYGVTIPPAETSPTAYRIFRDGVTGGDEYFLCENRRTLGFDAGLVRRQILLGLPLPEGLIVYHVDESNSGNSSDHHRLVDVVEASPWFEPDGSWYEQMDGDRDTGTYANLSQPNRGDNGDLWPGFTLFNADSTDWVGPRDRDRFAGDTVPPAEDSFCEPAGIAIENIALAGDDVVADFLVGAKAEPPAAVKTDHTWDFETGSDGWEFCYSYVHQDVLHAGGCPGSGGLWFGLDDPDFACPPGYGNGWNDFTWKTIWVVTGASVTVRHKYDLEPGYDYGYLEVRCAGDAGAAWHELASFTGSAACQTETFPIPGPVLQECQVAGLPKDAYSALDLRLRFVSDGGWSAEDGSFCGLGWWVDEVTVSNVYTGVGDEIPGAGLPAVLAAPSPNPFNPLTIIRYHVPAGARRVRLEIFDQRGRRVRTLTAGPVAAGWQQAIWNGRDDGGRTLASGIYFARLDVDGLVRIQKMAFVK